MRADRHWLHQKIVAFARQNGIKAAAREFGAVRNTIRKWLRRYRPGKPSSLVEIPRAPKSCPHKTPAGLEGQIVKLRKQTGFGAERLVQEFDLKISHNAVARIIRSHGLIRPRKKKPATKQLRSVKREWKLFGQLTPDTKYLQDIANYWPQMMRHRLPRFQYTAREVVSGACFAAYADELSKSYAVFMAEPLSAPLAWHGVDLAGLVWTWKPSTAWSKMNSWTGRGSELQWSFLPKPILTGATSTFCAKTAARNSKALWISF